MEKIYKKTIRAFGGEPNGSGNTSIFNNKILIRQIIILTGLAFTCGTMAVGYQNLPSRVKNIETDVLEIKVVYKSIDSRLGRIEDALLNRK